MAMDTVNGHSLPTNGNTAKGYDAEWDAVVTAIRIFASAINTSGEIDAPTAEGAIVITDATANAFAVGANGATNPVFNLDASTSSVATGINIKGAAAASGVAISVLSSGTNETLYVDAKGTGNIEFAATSTGDVNFGGTNPAFTVDHNAASAATGLKVTAAAAASGVAFAVISSGTNENLTVDAKGSGTITFNTTGTGNVVSKRALVADIASANALAVGANGTTNPVLLVDSATGSVATGIEITGAAAAAGCAIAVISSGTDENLTLDAKGTGTVTINGTATGAIALGAATGVTGALTVTSAGAQAAAIGANGATNPVLEVDASTGSVATGLKITGAAAASGLAVAVISSGANEALTVDAKGSGSISLNVTGTGDVILGRKLELYKIGSAASSASGLLIGVGTTANPAATSTADAKFVEIRAASTASSGDNRLMYLRYDLDGGGDGECIRAFTELSTSDVGTARGAHISLEVSNGSCCTGLGCGIDAQINIETGALTAGTYGVVNSEIYTGAADSDPSGMIISHLRCVNQGSATDDVDDDAFLFEIAGYTAGAGHLWDTTADLNNAQIDGSLKVRIAGVTKYIPIMDNANGS